MNTLRILLALSLLTFLPGCGGGGSAGGGNGGKKSSA